MSDSRDSQAGNEGVPSEEEIRQLPRAAQIAFAARCARRVQPLFTAFWPEAPKKYIDSVESAISAAEQAYNPQKIPGYDFYDTDAASANIAAGCAKTYASENAVNPADAAVNAAIAVIDPAAYAAAAEAAEAAAAADDDAVARMIRRDFERLKQTAMKEGWEDERYVPPEFFGAMWPEGEPEGWPGGKRQEDAVKREERVLSLRVYADEQETDAEEVVDEVIEFLQALNAYHIACGGGGLIYDGWFVTTPQSVPVGG